MCVCLPVSGGSHSPHPILLHEKRCQSSEILIQKLTGLLFKQLQVVSPPPHPPHPPLIHRQCTTRQFVLWQQIPRPCVCSLLYARHDRPCVWKRRSSPLVICIRSSVQTCNKSQSPSESTGRINEHVEDEESDFSDRS